MVLIPDKCLTWDTFLCVRGVGKNCYSQLFPECSNHPAIFEAAQDPFYFQNKERSITFLSVMYVTNFMLTRQWLIFILTNFFFWENTRFPTEVVFPASTIRLYLKQVFFFFLTLEINFTEFLVILWLTNDQRGKQGVLFSPCHVNGSWSWLFVVIQGSW